ncbi:hypothetical protein, partial [Streptomyces sp. NRRL S-146]|uniref:hypothetical protein n=1 Tax=Streptomyces sp. NRRL S-146 TaxID=1463884 RepID=UPI0004C948E0
MDAHPFVDVRGGGLGDQQTARAQDPGDPFQQGARIAPDADVAVHEQNGVPTALAGQSLEHRPSQRLAPEPDGVLHR